jgi:hypothetical protein
MSISYPGGSVNEITIEGDSPELLFSEQISADDADTPVYCVVTRGTAERTNPDKNRSEFVKSDCHDGRAQVFETTNEALAYTLSILETNGYSEPEANALLSSAGFDMDAYDSHLSSFTRKDRARRCINDSKERMRTIGSPADRAIFNPPNDVPYNPSWRSTNPSEDACELVTELAAQTPESSSCYLTAATILDKADDTRLEYCEGLALPKHPGRASTHAWVEYDNQVIEMTWPWHRPSPPADALYYGDSISADIVSETHSRRPTYASVLIPDELYYQYDDVQRALRTMFS